MLVLLPLIPSLCLALLGNFNQRRGEKERVIQDITNLSRVIAANEAGFIKNTRQLLATLSGFDFLVNATDRAFSTTHFQNLLKLTPDYLTFGLIETNGTVFCSAAAGAPESANLADRSYFRRTMATKTFSIGDFQIGRLTGERGINFGFPVSGATGGLHRVLFASLNIDHITEAARQVPLPAGVSVTVLDRAGTILARLPENSEWLGRKWPNAGFIQELQAAPRGVLTSTGLNGANRIYAVTSLSDDTAPAMFVIAGVPTEVLFAHANESLKHNLLILFATLIAALLVARYFAEKEFIRPLRSLSEAAHRIAAGDLSSRVVPLERTVELQELSMTFNTMAARLQSREAEVGLAHQRIQEMNAELENRVHERTAALEAANKELEAFSYSVSHDLRAPLRHLDGFAELLQRNQRDRLDDKGRRHLEVISHSARKMGTLIDELLVFSRMGRQELNFGPVDMQALVSEAVAELEPDYRDRRIEWKISNLPAAKADSAMLRQVWLNLISNAVKYSRPREVAHIEVGARQTETEWIYFIRDNGVGFDMRYADKLFGVFQRLHRENEFEGTGIGLANVRRIVLRHGGRTWAESAPGEGSTFYFSIKRDEKAQ